MQIISRVEAKNLKLTQYFTGKPCPNGHVAPRMVSNYHCCECKRNKTHYKKKERRKAAIAAERALHE